MKNIKKANISLKVSELESDIINKLVEDSNKNSFTPKSKSNIIREILIKEYVNNHLATFKELEININSLEDILQAIQVLGIDNIE